MFKQRQLFEGCNQLQDITFAEPVGGYSSFPIENHFMIGDCNEFYDWNGCRLKEDCEEYPILWHKVKEIDESYYNRIVRDCIK